MGGSGNETLDGGDDDDVMLGSAGNDSIAGGTGIDTIDYTASTGAVSINLQTERAQDGFGGTDTVTGIEVVNTGTFDDTIVGGTGAETVNAGGGNDSVVGSAGDDRLVGGGGTNTLDYTASTAAVTVNLATERANGTEIGSDTITGFAVVNTGSGGDSIVGGAGAETVNAGGGDDVVAGSAGDDSLVGGDGTNTLDYTASTAAVTVNLAGERANGTQIGNDTVSGFAVVNTGTGADSIAAARVPRR